VRRRVVPLVLALSVGIAGCTSSADGSGGSGSSTPEEPGTATASAPDGPLTVVADADPVAAAGAVSRALFDRAPVVVVARDGDRPGTLLAASAAVGLGVPLLLEPAGGGAADVLAAELDRLGTEAVLAVGEADGRAPSSATGEDTGRVDHEVVAVAAVADAVREAAGLELGPAEQVPDGDEAAAIAALDPGAPVALGGEDGEVAVDGSLPEVVRADPLDGTVVLATGEPGEAAALATARAAGATVVLTGGATDPRAVPEAIEALGDADAILVLGAGFAAEEGLDWKLATAATGVELPGGGQLLFPGRMLIALYGHPGTGALGVLGEQPLDAAIQRARDHAAPYEPLVDVPVVPAFEIIATVASSAAGPDGDYSNEAEIEVLRPWVEAAGEAGLYVVLDLQPGRTDFVTQAERYRSLLELPHVGLALDPEWRLGPDEVHLTQIGSVGIDEVNRVVTWLADLTRENALPQKLLVLHQFRVDMLPGREQLDTSRDELAVMVHVDGQGSQGDKQATWRRLHENPPAPLSWGWKNFYDEDLPMLTPEQTVAQVDPVPDLVSYQ
jgi:hypothetical protein